MDGIEQKSSSNLKQWFLVALIIGLILVVISGGIWVYQKAIGNKKSVTPETIPTPVEETPVTPEAISSEEVTPTLPAKAGLKIKILNGGGVKGEAGRAALLLEKAGYNDIKTANADRFDYEKTEIQIKESQKEFLQELSETLGEKYAVSTETKTLEEKDSFEVIIILGKS